MCNVDCVQTMLRIWDCFLLEGPKIIFRFALALLSIHETTIMQRADTISVMKILKAAAKLSYDVDGLFKVCTSCNRHTLNVPADSFHGTTPVRQTPCARRQTGGVCGRVACTTTAARRTQIITAAN
jgi:hypothetical protein